MPKILYIFNFKRLPFAFLIALGCILVVEYYGAGHFPQKYFNHEVDQVLYKIDTHQFNAEYLLIGDSVGRQLLEQFSTDPRFAWLATNQAIETTGQYFIVQRYLQNNSKPKAVIFAALPFFYKNLEQVYTENFVLRTFTKWSELWSIFRVTLDPVYLAKMVSYKFFFSLKYRLKLQNDLIGFTNSDSYSGKDSLASPKKNIGKYSFLEILKKKLAEIRLPPEKSSYVFFSELLEYLGSQGIPLYYIPVPIERQFKKHKSTNYRQHHRLVSAQLPPLKKQYPQFEYFSELVEHNRDLFADHTHYTPEGLEHGEKYMREKVKLILRENEN